MDEEDLRWGETDDDEEDEDEAEEEDDEDEDEVEEEEFDEVEEEEFDEFEDEYEEEVDELEEMTSPWVSSWMDKDGKTVHGIMVIDEDLNNPKNKCQFDDCSICYKPWTGHGKHQLCSLQCGHMYGWSCIKKWLLQSSSSRKCPKCNTFSSSEDIRLLYPPRVCVAAHQKASSTRRFPFTKMGYLQFKDYEMSRMIDAQKLQAYDVDRMAIVIKQQLDTVNLGEKLSIKRDTLLKCAKELEEQAEEMGMAHALRRRANLLQPRIDALEWGASALERGACTLGQRIHALGQRADAFESRVNFFYSMYTEQSDKVGTTEEYRAMFYHSQTLIDISINHQTLGHME